jgi:HAD superfamily hydrolase (TIGR01509 family)
MGVDTRQMRIKPEGPVGLKKRDIVLKAGVNYLVSKGHPDYTNQFMKVFNEVDQYSLDKFHEIIKPLPGANTLFHALKSMGCKIALATTDIKDRACRAISHLGLLDFVDKIVGADDVKKPKPDPEIIFSICEKAGIDINRTIMVGDAESDVLTGLNAGCLGAIGVESGLTSRERLLALTPLVIPDISYLAVH